MRLFNTLTQSIEPVEPTNGEVTLYVCGITPYDTTHLGHAFINVVYDTLRRHLLARGTSVRYVQNVTDIDDDILRKAREVGAAWDELGTRETERYMRDLTALNVLPPTRYVRASSEIGRMTDMIATLVAKKLAYIRDGWVYYDVSADPGFGLLAEASGIHGYDEWLATANERGNFPDDPRKDDPLDFVLWQAQQPGEPAWPGPCGDGRPGWHIECSAMATAYLGPRITIHGGGSDLIFPHHTCEIAQSEHATGEHPYVQVWMHCAMVALDGEKMSKSLGNLVLAADLLQRYSPDAVRIMLLANHYRRPWEYFAHEMATAAERARRFAAAAARSVDMGESIVTLAGDETAQRARAEFDAALDNDLKTAAALSILDVLATATLSSPTPARVATLRDLGAELGLTLGGVNPGAPTWTLE
ncbi:MAG: cysteine--tRNA ligase [Chloroflexota bacterium]|nr:cysteine--tRNA ligase [Chloroflexota bacterium]